VTLVRVAALDFVSALHNWRRDPSPDNARALVVSGNTLSGFALELEQQLALEREKVPRPRELCRCGGAFGAVEAPAFKHMTRTAMKGMCECWETCNCCGVLRGTVLFQVSEAADATRSESP
jgi:hypothetical protein